MKTVTENIGPEVSRTSDNDPNVVQQTTTIKPEVPKFIQTEFNFS